MATAALESTILGYPRIGPNRQIKRALEAFWSGGDVKELATAVADHRTTTAKHLSSLGLNTEASVPFDGAVIDQVLDLAVVFGLIPQRFRDAGFITTDPDSQAGFELLTALSRGTDSLEPLEMTKWFDTNYHYYVPEVEEGVAFGGPNFAAQAQAFAARFTALAEASGATTRPALVGPVTFLLLSKEAAEAGGDRFARLEELTALYAQLLEALAAAGAPWVQLEEPALATDGWEVDRAEVIKGLTATYTTLGAVQQRPSIFVPVGYGYAGDDALAALGASSIEAVGIDLERGATPSTDALKPLAGKTLGAGVVGGLNIWRTDLERATSTLETLGQTHQGELVVTTSTSLLHVPHDVSRETQWSEDIRSWLAFADQKVQEVLTLAKVVTKGRAAIETEIAEDARRRQLRTEHPEVTNAAVRQRLAAVTDQDRQRASAEDRRAAQQASLGLPELPTTTIGSFPQTPEIRKTRAQFRSGKITEAEYVEGIKAQIADAVNRQDALGLDVLVHGEAERNDMVQYFAEHFAGFITSKHGWVQSYGSRCLRPPILFGDVQRGNPFTVEWINYAASLTNKHVKGMLTGPVTILAWSFVRDDQPLSDTADQIALALRDEVQDLQAAGVQIIQVDEPALRELLPLKTAEQPDYLRWSVESFRLATSGAKSETQVHTHLCYSEFETVIDAIDALDADVTTLEASRSGFEVVDALSEHGYARGIGPGVWDIHSPRVPSQEELEVRLKHAAEVLGTQKVWSNPDCGLKTRGWEETEASLRNLVAATVAVRSEVDTTA